MQASLKNQLAARFQSAVVAAFGAEFAGVDPLLTSTNNPKNGDFQANVAMSLSKRVGKNPREVAAAIVAQLDGAGLIEKTDIAGPGFINVTVQPGALTAAVGALLHDARLGCPVPERAPTVVVDYSSPNVAKEMHVGHLRSTVIGDALARVLEFQGNKVVRQNHVGDWGTQFGMLIAHLDDLQAQGKAWRNLDITSLYQEAKKRDDAEPAFAERARKRVVGLQAGEATAVALWKELFAMSARHFEEIYERLQVKLAPSDIRGESAYNADLAGVVADLKKQGLLHTSEGAQVVYPAGFKREDGEPLPMIVQKGDGGYLYATTDLAAARYRIEKIKASRVVYVTDARQSQHFAMVFETMKQAGWTGSTHLDHVPFGMVLGPDKRPFKTRDGGTVKLIDLIEEAQSRATKLVTEKNPDLSAAEQAQVGKVVGIGCLKYADLSGDRVKDYVFDWNRMVSFDGNTAAYVQYSYTRARSILRKAEVSDEAVRNHAIRVDAPEERQLALKLMQLPAVVDSVAQSLEPHRLCNYLYDLAAFSHKFVETCPVLKAEDEATKQSRLALCLLMADTLRLGLDLLGIGVLERM